MMRARDASRERAINLPSGDAGDDAVVGDNVGRADDYLRATSGDEVRRAA